MAQLLGLATVDVYILDLYLPYNKKHSSAVLYITSASGDQNVLYDGTLYRLLCCFLYRHLLGKPFIYYILAVAREKFKWITCICVTDHDVSRSRLGGKCYHGTVTCALRCHTFSRPKRKCLF
jgi:hypothetical protein